MTRQRYVTDGLGTRISHTGIKVWYVMCGTKGKEVEWAYLTGKQISDTRIETVDKNGCIGHCIRDSTFFTRQCAIDNWRYHSKAETEEHATLLDLIGDQLKRHAHQARKNLRPTKPWQDL